jgi:uncharacterized protein (DUF983 family)
MADASISAAAGEDQIMRPDAAKGALSGPRPATWRQAGADPGLFGMLKRGARGRCPACGEGRLFAGYLRPVERCEACGTELARIRADDAPPYFTIFIAGKLLAPLVFGLERGFAPPLWVHAVVWGPVIVATCILLLRPVKGATIGLMLRLGIDGSEHGPESGRA